MGKYIRSSKEPPSPAAAVAVDASSYPYLTLRSGRRVPAAAAAAGDSPCGRRSHRRGGGGRRCAKNVASARECGAKSAASASRRHRRCKAVGCSQGDERAELSPSTQGNCVVVVVSSDICGERRDSGEVVEHAGGGEHNPVAAGRTSLSPPEAEIEAFFAAAELAERRRFVETYNYDVALDCPLQGRFQWEPVST